jgi:hypothetical protein
MTRGLLIIQSAHVPSAIALATSSPFLMSEQAAADLWEPFASPTGTEPATHHVCAGNFTPEHWNAILGLAMLLPWADAHEYDLIEQPDYPRTRLAELNLLPLEVPQA